MKLTKFPSYGVNIFFNPRIEATQGRLSTARSLARFADDKAAEAWLAERLEEPGPWLMEAIL